MTTEQHVIEHCENLGLRTTTEQIDEAVNLVDNEGYTVEDACAEAIPGHPQKPT